MRLLLLLLLGACSADVSDLLADLDSINPAVRQQALIDARTVDDEQVLAALERLLQDADPQVRLDAVLALDALPTSPSPTNLLPLMNDKSGDVSRAAIDAVGRLQSAESAPALIAIVQTERPPLNAIWALGQTGAPEAVPVLAKLRNHTDPFVSYNADQALRELD